jgi:hypothetical protein
MLLSPTLPERLHHGFPEKENPPSDREGGNKLSDCTGKAEF